MDELDKNENKEYIYIYIEWALRITILETDLTITNLGNTEDHNSAFIYLLEFKQCPMMNLLLNI